MIPLTAGERARQEADRFERAGIFERLISTPAPEIDAFIGHRLTQDGAPDRADLLSLVVGSVENAERKPAIDVAGNTIRYYEFRDLGDEA